MELEGTAGLELWTNEIPEGLSPSTLLAQEQAQAERLRE